MDFSDRRLWYGVVGVIVILLVIAWAAGWLSASRPRFSGFRRTDIVGQVGHGNHLRSGNVNFKIRNMLENRPPRPRIPGEASRASTLRPPPEPVAFSRTLGSAFTWHNRRSYSVF